MLVDSPRPSVVNIADSLNGEIKKDDYLRRKRKIETALLEAMIDKIEDQLQNLEHASPRQQNAIINWMIARIEIRDGQIQKITPRERAYVSSLPSLTPHKRRINQPMRLRHDQRIGVSPIYQLFQKKW